MSCEPSIGLTVYVPSIETPEHRQLRDAVDAALVQGTVTWLRNSAGTVVAAIVPASSQGRLA